jgi:hypothetical protein
MVVLVLVLLLRKLGSVHPLIKAQNNKCYSSRNPL